MRIVPQGLNLSAIGVAPDRRGFVPVDEHMQVLDQNGKPVPHVFCIGDANGTMKAKSACHGQMPAGNMTLLILAVIIMQLCHWLLMPSCCLMDPAFHPFRAQFQSSSTAFPLFCCFPAGL